MSSNPAFEQALREVSQLTKKPNNEEMLKLYGLYKIATGHDFSKAEQPYRVQLEKYAKWTAWQKEVDEGTTVDLAQEKYIMTVETLKEKYGFDPNKEPETIGA
jgi:diazepam-binding inhibitor (GABA receptor modulating acyl-CoA-binding protein)